MDGDSPDTWLSIGQGRPVPLTSMDLTTYGPILSGPVRGAPFHKPGTAERPIPLDIFDPDTLEASCLRAPAKVLGPMDLSLQLLDRQVFERISRATNKFARDRGAGEPLLAGWRDTDWREMFRFFLANMAILAIFNTRPPIDDELLFRNPLLARLVGAKRFHQLTLAWRLKWDKQTPDKFLDYAKHVICDQYDQMLSNTTPMMILHTYHLPLSCRRDTKARIAQCRLTVLKAGRYILRVVFHKMASDSDQSGNTPTISIQLLEELLHGIPLEGKYFTTTGEATLEMAKFFHLRGAYFVGSVGPQAYRLPNPHKYNIPSPELPSTGLYLEPYPGIREVILLREYTRHPSYVSWIGFPVMKDHGIQHTHLLCNIGAGAQCTIDVPGKGGTCTKVSVPESLLYIQSVAVANEVSMHQSFFENYSSANNLCMLWHQRVTMHLLIISFMNGWHAHALATDQPLYRFNASDDIMHHLLGFMYDWVILQHNLSAEPRVRAGGDETERCDVSLATGALQVRTAGGSTLQLCIKQARDLASDGHTVKASSQASETKPPAPTDMAQVTIYPNMARLVGPGTAPSPQATSESPEHAARVKNWSRALWKTNPIGEVLMMQRPGQKAWLHEWHGYISHDASESPKASSAMSPMTRIILRDLKSWPLLTPSAIEDDKWPTVSFVSATELLYWDGVRMMPATTTDGYPWRGATRRRRSSI